MTQAFNSMFRHTDVLVGGAVILLVAMMIIPLPVPLLSFFQALNITISLVILLVSMYTLEPLEFSVFPSLLLLTTLFRLALNVSATRLILLHGEGGAIIETFGQFVVGGNAIVGFLVFLILVIIQFVVITRGAERVAEVAARFTLDAMPGKQMSIDADLNAGLINERQARERRQAIEREADFYGAMDGASKFVKGDAIAALIITGIIIVGGFIIGIVQLGMTWDAALHRFTLLTIGDGLVTQIPALLISTATGIVVTRAASDAQMGYDVAKQTLAHPRALWIAAATLVSVSFVPGMPKLTFWILAVFFAWLGYVVNQQRSAIDQVGETDADVEDAPMPGQTAHEHAQELLQADPLEINLGYNLLSLAEGENGGPIMERITLLRQQVAKDLGFILPLVRVRDDIQLDPNRYTIKIWSAVVGEGELYPDRFLVMDIEGGANFQGIATREPAFKLAATWVESSVRREAELAGCTVVDAGTVLATHLTEIIKKHAAELLSRQAVKELLDNTRVQHPALVDELVPNQLSLAQVHRVLQNLLSESISIRNLPPILEAISEQAVTDKSTQALTDAARQVMARQITQSLPVENGRLLVITLDPEAEQIFLSASLGESVDPEDLQLVLRSLQSALEDEVNAGRQPVLLTSPNVRSYVKQFTRRMLANLPVVSYNELDPEVVIESARVVTVH